MGSLLDKAMREGEALLLLRECRKLSSLLDTVQSSQAHLTIYTVVQTFIVALEHYL